MVRFEQQSLLDLQSRQRSKFSELRQHAEGKRAHSIHASRLLVGQPFYIGFFPYYTPQGGWWWKSCGRGLNGLYLHDPQDLTARQGIVWFRWRGWDYTLKKATMMIKPKGPQPQVAGTT